MEENPAQNQKSDVVCEAETTIKESESFLNLGVVVNNKDEVLLIRRAKEEVGKDGAILKWTFPGGGQRSEPKETRNECIKRHVLAQTGYEIQVLRQLSLQIHPQFRVMIAYHLCAPLFPKPVAEPSKPDEVAEIRWVKPSEVRSLFTSHLDAAVAKELKI